ncbi:MAG: PfkB family carbohydrate kinase [Vescimonas sp.]
MTQRERQILNWIEADPMISQQELAERAGITRSSVAVHISNLMKKGCIAGKGYIVTRSPYVTVVGGMNMDIGGWPSEELVAQDSNPGRVRMSPGGVGRNIAHNMSLMGLDVRLLTAFGDDVYAQKLAAVLRRAGHRHLPVPGDPRRSHLHLSFHQRPAGGYAAGGVSDMDIYRPSDAPCLPGGAQAAAGGQSGGGHRHQPPGGEHRMAGG